MKEEIIKDVKVAMIQVLAKYGYGVIEDFSKATKKVTIEFENKKRVSPTEGLLFRIYLAVE